MTMLSDLDLSTPQIGLAAAVAAVVMVLTWSLANSQSKQKANEQQLCRQGIPRVPSPLYYLGIGVEYFKGPLPLSKRLNDEYGPTYSATVFGRTWLFVHNQEDQAAILRAPEKHVSMLKANFRLAGFTFPQENLSDYPTADIMHKISLRGGSGPSGTPMFTQALRKEKRLAWISPLRDLLRDTFAELPAQGSVSLFELCQDLITSITVRVLLGDVVTRDKGLLETFVKLFNEGDPEVGFGGPIKSFGTILETSILGERLVFRKVRTLLYPYIDEEIQKICVEGKPEQDGESVMQTFVRLWYKKMNKDVKLVRLARRRIVNDMFLFTFAAFTNSYAGTAWLIYHVLQNTSGVGDKIRQEIDEMQKLFDSNAFQNKENTNDLNCPHLEWTLYEISRLYTPGNLVRDVLAPIKLPSSGLEVPAGISINMSLGLAHRDPNVYPDPLKFDPLRHAPGSNSNVKSPMFTFGAGAHPCVGRKFAVYEMALFAAEILNQFDLQLEDLPPTDAFTASVMGDQHKNHPRLDPSQVGFLWRTLDPVMVQYKRKKSVQA